MWRVWEVFIFLIKMPYKPFFFFYTGIASGLFKVYFQCQNEGRKGLWVRGEEVGIMKVRGMGKMSGECVFEKVNTTGFLVDIIA